MKRTQKSCRFQTRAVHPTAARGALELLVLWPLLLLGFAPRLQAGGTVQSGTELALRAALAGGGNVVFTTNLTITVTQPLPINQETVIDAQGHTVVISGGGTARLFDAAANLTLRGLSVVTAKSSSSGAALLVHPSVVVVADRCVFGGNSVLATNGLAGTIGTTNSNGTGRAGSAGMNGASALGGAIYNQGNLALVRCTLTNNTVTAGSGGAGGPGGNGGGLFEVGGNGGSGGAGGEAAGGAVYNLANLTVIDCLFSQNGATGGNGGAGGSGGTGNNPGLPGDGGTGGVASGAAIYNALNLTLVTSTFSTNSAVAGAAAAAGIQGNGSGINGKKGADAFGGALFNHWWAAVTNCTFYTNSVTGGPGGNGGNGDGTFAVPGNGGDGGDGLGGSVANDNTLTMVNCTVFSGAAFGGTNGLAGIGNFTASDGQPGTANGGNVANPSGGLSVLGTILAGSRSGPNVFGSLIDLGFNLSSDFTSSLGGSSLQNTGAKLGPLAFNGGATPTMSLLAGSPAVDRIPPELTPPTDQRGFRRPINGAGDIGAFELGAATNAVSVALSVRRSSTGSIQLTGQGTSGANYLVQASTNLVNWQTIATNTATIQFSDPVTNFSTRFYRLSR